MPLTDFMSCSGGYGGHYCITVKSWALIKWQADTVRERNALELNELEFHLEETRKDH